MPDLTTSGTTTAPLSLAALGVSGPSPVDTLDTGTQRTDTATPITVYFVPAGAERDGVTSEGWSDYERAQFMAALATISAVANVTFVETTNPNADFQVVLDSNELVNDPNGGPGLLGYFYLPNGSSSSVGVFNASGFGWDANGLQPGGLGFSTIVHEALHGLGLGHPHDGSTILPGLNPSDPNYPFGQFGDFGFNQAVYTIMSYNGGYNGAPTNSFNYGDAAGPMAFDIAALQDLYGANVTYASGSDIYELPDSNSSGTAWLSIWDTGGTDTISYSGSRNVTIDLRPATLQYEEGGGGHISAADGISGGYTIAYNVVIENAIGGSGNDVLVGNQASNTLTGNGGNDILFGGADDDDLLGGGGNDTAYGGAGNDDIDGGANDDTLYGNSGGDDVVSASGTNTIYGGSGYDILEGGSGVDTIFGGSGNDTITGGGGADILLGERGDDTLDGGTGADTLIGGMGQDTMTGGADADTFVFVALSDSWTGKSDEITDFQVGTDKIDLSVIDANLSAIDDQAFTFIEGGAGTGNEGEVWITDNTVDTFVFIDRDGDGFAEMTITLSDTIGVTASDFIL